jgi:hypothetical protein
MASDAIRDPYGEHVAATDGPLVGGYAITPGPLDLPAVTRAIMVGGGGDIAVVLRNGDAVTLPGLYPGAVYPFRVTRVLSEGTTATGILGLF